MTTLPTQRAGSASGARWLVPIGLVVTAAGVVLLLNTGNEELVNWFRDNSSCNERPCTYDEAKSILIGLGGGATVIGVLSLVFGIWRALRTRDAGPTLPAPAPTRSRADAEVAFGLPDKAAGDSPDDQLARLDEQLAAGGLSPEAYLRRREAILRRM